MKKFIPWRKASTILVALAVMYVGQKVFQRFSPSRGVEGPPSTPRGASHGGAAGLSSSTEGRRNDSLNYGVVVDCGSSGSRVFVYCWEPHSGLPDSLLDIKVLRNATDQPVVFKIKPGLSSFSRQPWQASNYLAPLLDFAVANIPRHKIKETSLFVFATAGLRLLPPGEQAALLNDIRTDVGLDYDFVFSDTHVEIISGEEEAIYAWTAINHALGKFNHQLDDDPLVRVDVSGKIHVRKRTVGMLDLGGASLQVALELPQMYSVYDPRIKDNVFAFNLGCTTEELSHKYKVYARSFLGHGSDSTRSKYVEWLLSGAERNSSSFSSSMPSSVSRKSWSPVYDVDDPCLTPGDAEVRVRDGTTFRISGRGRLEECRASLGRFLQKSEDCLVSNNRRCSIDGAILPDMNFRSVEFYGFSEFYYTMQDVLEMGGAYSYHYFKDRAQDYCATNWTTIESWKNSSRFPRADSERYRLQCFKSAWVLEVLHRGLNFPKSYRHLTSVQQLDGYEVHWSLGSIVHKTKYFPLRYISEKLSTSRARSRQGFFRLFAGPPWSTVVPVLLLSTFILSVCCVHLFRPLKTTRKRQRCVGTCTDPEQPVVVGAGGSEVGRPDDRPEPPILRTRSYATVV